MGLSGFGGGFGDAGDCTSQVSSMSVGNSCNLPDGSNIAVWNGQQLTNPAGGSIDPANAGSLVAAGWPPSQVAGAAGGVPSSSSVPNAGSQSSWWSSALTALTQGVVAGAKGPTSTIIPCVAPGVPVGCNFTPAVVAPPWYTTPLGIGGIVLTLGLGYFLLKK